MDQAIDLIAVLVTVLLTGSELAIGVFVHPVLSKLHDAAHAEAAKPLARLLGRVMPFWYAAALLLVVVSLLTRASGARPLQRLVRRAFLAGLPQPATPSR